jgi:hypothetical protein
MRTWLHSVVDTIRGRVSGKAGRLDTATHMAMGADFSRRDEAIPPELRNWRQRDDAQIFKSADHLADIDLLEELVRIVNEARARDAEDERRLYDPMFRAEPSFQRQRPDRER